MSRIARSSRSIVRHAQLILLFATFGAVACADDAATAPRLAPAARASNDNAPYPIADFTITPSEVIGGRTAIGTVTLATPAPAGGAQLRISPSNYWGAHVVPDSFVTVPANATTVSFTIQTYTTPVDIGPDFTAIWGAYARFAPFRVLHGTIAGSASPNPLNFAPQALGTVSAAQVVVVRDSGTVAIAIGPITISGPFAQTNNCPATLAAGATCNAWVTYTPTAVGAQSGLLSVANDAPNTPWNVTLNGSGFVATPALSITPTSLGFGSVALGTATSARVVKITSQGNAPLNISSVTLGGTNRFDFLIGGDSCTNASLLPGASCTVLVSFEPLGIGARTATLTIAHNASTGSSVVSLSGTGVKSSGWIP